MTSDRPLVLLLAALATLMVATVAGLRSLSVPEDARGENWKVWRTLERAERAALVDLMRQMQQRDDARSVLQQARAYSAAGAVRQARYRDILSVLAPALDSMSASQRRALYRLPPSGRAAELYRAVETRFPRELESLIRPAGGQN